MTQNFLFFILHEQSRCSRIRRCVLGAHANYRGSPQRDLVGRPSTPGVPHSPLVSSPKVWYEKVFFKKEQSSGLIICPYKVNYCMHRRLNTRSA